MGYELEEVSQDYFSHNAKLAEWIVGLTIGELAFIISQNLFDLNYLFYFFLAFSFSSILIAIIIMYVIALVADGKLNSVLFLLNSAEKPPKEEFDKVFDKRVGKLGTAIIEFVIGFKLFQWLIISFFCGSIIMVILISKYLVSTQNCANIT